MEIMIELGLCPMVTDFQVIRLLHTVERTTNILPSESGNFFVFFGYNLHTITFKVYNSVSFSILCNHQHCLVPEHFYQPKRNPISLRQSLLISSSPQPLATTDLLSVSKDLPFWLFHICGVVPYMTFYVWLLPHSMIFLRFIHILACMGTLFLFLN